MKRQGCYPSMLVAATIDWLALPRGDTLLLRRRLRAFFHASAISVRSISVWILLLRPSKHPLRPASNFPCSYRFSKQFSFFDSFRIVWLWNIFSCFTAARLVAVTAFLSVTAIISASFSTCCSFPLFEFVVYRRTRTFDIHFQWIRSNCFSF